MLDVHPGLRHRLPQRAPVEARWVEPLLPQAVIGGVVAVPPGFRPVLRQGVRAARRDSGGTEGGTVADAAAEAALDGLGMALGVEGHQLSEMSVTVSEPAAYVGVPADSSS